MARTANPIEAMREAVAPYVTTGEAHTALEHWKEVEPALLVIRDFAELRAALANSAESYETDTVLPAMLRLYDSGDRFACLVVMEAFAPALYRAAISIRFEVSDRLSECASRMLFWFCSSVWHRDGDHFSGAALVTQAKMQVDLSFVNDRAIALQLKSAVQLDRTIRFGGIRAFFEEVIASAQLVDDLLWAIRNEWNRRSRMRAAARGRWEVLAGQLCRDGVPIPRPDGSPRVTSDRAWGLWGASVDSSPGDEQP